VKGRGEFFAIDRSVWLKVCAAGLNPAVAYLVLSRFSDRANRVTAASVNAIERHTNISRGRARDAIRKLVDAGIIAQSARGSRPSYDLRPGVPPGLASSIWLPNSLVTGAAEEIAPVELVRQTQDVMTLRLLVDLYDAQNLREDGGINRAVTYQKFSRKRVGQRGQFVVWGFSDGTTTVCWRTEITRCHHRTKLTAAEREAGENVGVDWFARFGNLTRLGLVEWVPYLFEGEGDEAERLHPCGTYGGNAQSIEGRIGAAAEAAARALLTPEQEEWADADGLILVPVFAHLVNATVIGVARLRYLPRTSLTAAWFGDDESRGTKWLRHYNTIEMAIREGQSLGNVSATAALAG
jgi:hypothetical protein